MLRRILIFIGYLALATFIVGATFVLVAYGNDYTYDFKTHKIIQEGHVIIDSVPSGLRIRADGKLLTKKTPYQAAYLTGTHTFSLSESGYWPWSKTMQVYPGVVSLAGYPVLVPKRPAETVLASTDPVIAQAISLDHRYLAYITSGPKSALYVMNINGPSVARVYVPQAANSTTPAETLVNVFWSADGSHLLLQTSIGGTSNFYVMAADGSGQINLTKQYGFDFSGIEFSDSNWQQLYWVSQGGLRKLDLSSQSVSDVLADNVLQFWPISDGRVLYVEQSDQERSLWSIDTSGNRQELIDGIPGSGTYTIDYANYNGTDELGVVPSKTRVGTLYSGIFGSTPVAKTLAQNVDGVEFSPDGHFIMFESTDHFVTYDIEQSQIFHRTVSYSVNAPAGTFDQLDWFDSYHVLANDNDTLYWGEYDGTNVVHLGDVAANLPAYYTSDGKSVLVFRPSKNGMQIVRIRIEK